MNLNKLGLPNVKQKVFTKWLKTFSDRLLRQYLLHSTHRTHNTTEVAYRPFTMGLVEAGPRPSTTTYACVEILYIFIF